MYLVQTWATPWIVWLLKYDTAYQPVDVGSEWSPKWDPIGADGGDLIDLKHGDA